MLCVASLIWFVCLANVADVCRELGVACFVCVVVVVCCLLTVS